ncbi:hypothetical protein M8C21_033405, partial [Ambrosia artemisiifolia]
VHDDLILEADPFVIRGYNATKIKHGKCRLPSRRANRLKAPATPVTKNQRRIILHLAYLSVLELDHVQLGDYRTHILC